MTPKRRDMAASRRLRRLRRLVHTTTSMRLPPGRGMPQQADTTTDDGAGITESGPLVLFDGVCNLCSWSVQFLGPRDRTGLLWFAAVQSRAGQAVLARSGLPTDHFDSFVLLEAGRIHVKSDAFFRVVRYMRFPWPLLMAGRLMPRRIADWLYDRIAGSRYRIFGRKDVCMIPRPELMRRFLP
jgi:predicted DCC family thiol-disulfide oxidoreductase YuxK